MTEEKKQTEERSSVPKFRAMNAVELAKVRRYPLELEAGYEKVNLKTEKSRRVFEMGFDGTLLKQVSSKVAALSVSDLEDLGKRFAGLPVENRNIDGLTVDDIQGLDELFRDQKEQALADIAGRVGASPIGGQRDLAEVDVSCCCCTPCCCCAATETNPLVA